MKTSKKDLVEKVAKLEEELDKQKLTFTKKELQEFIKKEVIDNLIVEVKEGDSYQYGGGYKAYKEIGVFWGNEQVYTSTSFE